MIDHDKRSAIGHSTLDFCSPISSHKAQRLIALLDLDAGAKVVDVGCGKAEMLIQTTAYSQVCAVGIDKSSYFMTAAHEAIANRAPGADITLHEVDAQQFAYDDDYDAAFCIGSTHIYGGFAQTLQALKKVVKPGGVLVVGDVFWEGQPTPECATMFEIANDETRDYAGTVQLATEQGFTPIYIVTANNDEWDDYIWEYIYALERYPETHTDDADNDEIRAYANLQRERYIKCGRGNMGFGIYVFQVKP